MGLCFCGVLCGAGSPGLWGSDSPLICIPVTLILEFWDKDMKNGVWAPNLGVGGATELLLLV